MHNCLLTVWTMFGTELFLGPVTATAIVVTTTILFIYWYSTRNFSYWEKRGIPYAKPVPLLGSLVDLLKKPLHEIELERYFKYGPVYGHFEGNVPVLTVADPVLLRQILVKDFQYFVNRRSLSTGDKIIDNFLSALEGEDWKRVRAIVSPTFTSGKLRREFADVPHYRMMGIFRDCSKTLVQNFKAAAEEKKPIDAKKIYGAFTMDIIASSAFSMKIDSHNDPNNKFVQVAKNGFSTGFGYRFALFQLLPLLMRLFKVSVVPPDTTGFFKDVTMQIIEERKRTGQVRNDFLQLLMDTAKEVSEEQKWETKDKEKNIGDITSNYEGEESNQQVLKYITNKKLTIDELVAQCVIFFLAGYDTTGSLLSFATYMLALNEDIQEKAYEEIQEVLKDNKGEMTYETIQSMKYLDNVISETLRLYPPSRLERVAQTDYKLGDTGITVPKGMILQLPQYPIHRDPKYFPDPEKFDPDRFNPEQRAERDQYTYIPFGSGPRNCVGMRFALLEAKVCLSYVIGTFKIKRCSQTKVPLEFVKGQIVLQPKEIKVQLELRENSPFK